MKYKEVPDMTTQKGPLPTQFVLSYVYLECFLRNFCVRMVRGKVPSVPPKRLRLDGRGVRPNPGVTFFGLPIHIVCHACAAFSWMDGTQTHRL